MIRKVYVMIGTNDCPSRDYETFEENYGFLVRLISYSQPDAIIYLVSNLRMSRNGEINNKGRGFDNDRMGRLNEIISGFEDGERVFFLEINEIFINEDGYLPEDSTFDGFHLYARGYSEIGDYLRSHAVQYIPN